jgi:hypothetical protein
MDVVLAALVSLLVGGALGWLARGRALDAARRERFAEHERIRTSVMPVLERRASALSIGKDRKSDDPVERAVEVAAAIQAAEEKLVLPFTDTLEISRSELARKAD